MPKRGEIWLANLNPPHGTEPGKTRPVLVIQSQALLDAGHPSTYIIPLTTQLIDNAEPLRIRLAACQGLPRDSDLLMDQMRAIDNRRLVRGPLVRLPRATMRQVQAALLQLLDIDTL
ncbi:MAG TPA: type II toxin-antitoxin system PemK/MazF family toxin [Bryobacteraceae bacterium]|nr:type II toxin-antitoxin system PemK/MazF family toxin [Bryobacteraceae bacterium]